MSSDVRSTLSRLDADVDVVQIRPDEPVENAVTVAIDRPERRNALNGAVRECVSDVFSILDGTDAFRVAVVTGTDEAKAFVAGADVGEFRERGVIEQRAHSKRPRLYEHVAGCSLPVIARINGHALGGGLELALACDVRIAHERAKLGSPEINLGIIPGGGATQRLPRLIGEGQAMRLILSGDLIDAEEAAEIGLVEMVAAGEEFDNIVTELVTSIAEKSPVALSYAKEAVKAAGRMGVRDGIDYEAQLFTQLFATEDKNEGIDAFFEDRDPEWQGR